MKTLTLCLAAAIALGACGCQMGEDYYGVHEALQPEPVFEKALVSEAAVALRRAFPPGKTTFYFPHGEEIFAGDLEGQLRKAGYAFRSERPSGEAAKDVTEIGYTLDHVGREKALVVLRLVAGDSWQMSRVYQRQKDGTVRPSGPVIIRKG